MMESANHHLTTITKLSQGKSKDIELLVRFLWGVLYLYNLNVPPHKIHINCKRKRGSFGWENWEVIKVDMRRTGAGWDHTPLDRVSEKDTVITAASSYCHILANHVAVAQECPTLWDPMDCSPQGSSVHEIVQAGILQWVAMPSPGDLPDPRI